MADEVSQPLSVTLATATLTTGQAIPVAAVRNLTPGATPIVDLGDGVSHWLGLGRLLPAYRQPGNYNVIVMDGNDATHRATVPVTVNGPLEFVGGQPAVNHRLLVDTARFQSLGAACPDNQFGVTEDPDKPGGLLFYTSTPFGNQVAIQCSRGDKDDPFARGFVVQPILGGSYRWPHIPYGGPVVDVEWRGRRRLLMASCATDEHPAAVNGAPYRGRCDWLWRDRDDPDPAWRYGGLAWDHAISWSDWTARPEETAGYMGGGSGLFGMGDDLYLPLNQVNAPLFGEHGALTNWCPFGLAKVSAPALCDVLDRGRGTRFLTRKWQQPLRAWTEPYNGVASPVAHFGVAWCPQIVHCPELDLFLCVAQRGTTPHTGAFFLSYSHDLLSWSPPQLLFEDDSQPGPAYPTPLAVGGLVGRTFDVHYTVLGSDVAEWRAFTVRLVPRF